MGEIVNLRQKRKQKARAEKDRQAEANRAAFGRTKTEKIKARDESDRTVRRLDQAKLDD
jgi:hypothetical protein